MNSISELRLLTPRPVALAGPGHQTAKTAAAAAQPQSAVTAPLRDERPAAPTPEPPRAQSTEQRLSAEQRLRRNRPEEGPPQIGTGGPAAELSFGDFLDLINPLQHIPIVSTIYRAITGDQIGGPAKILGGMLFGGPIGFVAAIFDTIVNQATGRDLGETVLAAFTGEDAAPAVQVADARDIQGIPAPDDAAPDDGSEDGPPMTSGATGPISGHSGAAGLEPGGSAAVAVTAAVLPPNPPAATLHETGSDRVEIDKTAQIQAVTGIVDGGSNETRSVLGGKPLVPAAPGPGALPAPATARAPVVAPTIVPVVAVELVSADAPMPGSPHLVPNLATSDRGFSERMLEALDQYQAQAAQGFRDNSRADRRLDLNL